MSCAQELLEVLDSACVEDAVAALVWDFDGTLGYRTGGMWSAALVEVLREELPDCGATADQLRPYLGTGFPWHSPERPHLHIRSADQWWEAIQPVLEAAYLGLGVGLLQARGMAKQVRDYYPDPGRWRLYDDVVPTLDHLSSEGWRHFILSNHVPELPTILRQLGLAQRITRLFNSAETGYEKPHPQAFAMVVDALGSAAKLWVIGDSYETDVLGAESLGIPAILVRGYHPAAKYCCPDLGSVAAIVRIGQK